MNVTELARQLKVDTSDMLDKLPDLGFDIGKRAIKVDDRIAEQIITTWKAVAKKSRQMEKIAEIRGETEEVEEEVDVEAKEVAVPAIITVREYAAILGLPVNEVLVELMKNGILTSMNEKIDFDTATIIGENLGFKVIEEEGAVEGDTTDVAQENLKTAIEAGSDGSGIRPPVVVVMGHVDHGKTKILDAIRSTDVVAGESGGITQHIGAYQVHRNDQLLTFIDTPGHEAFTAMRSRGARVADVAIIVIAADDGIQPQTKEAIKIAQDAKLPFVIAINKIDRSEANVEKIKTELSQINLLPEDWGGKVVCVPVSALNGDGIEDLLETVLLMVEVEVKSLKSNLNALAMGTIVESHVDKGEGPVATILVQVGTLKIGDVLSTDGNYFGRVRSLRDYNGKEIKEVLPGTPAKILGLKIAPSVGSILEVVEDEKLLNKNFKQHKNEQAKDMSVQTSDDDNSTKYINLILKGDVLGSVEAIVESLAKLDTAEVKIRILSKGLGVITEADVLKAETTDSTVIGFHVKPLATVESLARDKKVKIETYDVIYHLVEKIEKEIKDLKQSEKVKKLVGKLNILKIFRKDVKSMVIGGQVTEGGLCLCDIVIAIRDGEPLTSGKVSRLECARVATEKVNAGQECGLTFEGEPILEEGDVLEFYQEVTK